MDILTHAISGTAVATCAASFVQTSPSRKAKILLAGTLGGMFPDIDAISMWSRFDATIGKLFGLSHTGKAIYSAKFWYSHHAFFHSLLASILFGILFVLIAYSIHKLISKKQLSVTNYGKSHLIYFIVFVLGFWSHLAGDLPTPSSSWGGVAMFFPSSNYVGGSGKIWWWNNYDIFLLILGCIILNLSIPSLFKAIRNKSKIFTSAILAITLGFILIQVNSREYNYAYDESRAKYAEMEQNSKKEQERILGQRLYQYMEKFDGILKIHF